MSEIRTWGDWDEIRTAFRWRLPPRYNLAEDMVGKWARRVPRRLAMLHLPASGPVERWSYGALEAAASRLANVFSAKGIGRGDRVALLLAQSPEVILGHVAAYKLGAVAVPLFTLFGPEGLEYRLAQSGARLLVTTRAEMEKIAEIRDRLPALRAVLAIDGPAEGAESLPALLDRASESCTAAETGPEHPAFISYTSGTTGPPKGALHAHRVLLGHLPGIQLTHDGFPRPGDLTWTPADWAWMGGLCNIAMPSLRLGTPVLSHRMERFDPERAFALMAEHGVTRAFLPPTALKLMRGVEAPGRFALELRSVGSGGESLGPELLAWGRNALGLTINEFYGQTECNLVLGNSAARLPVRDGSTGRAFPGSQVAILDPETHTPLPPGEIGEIAVRRGDAAMFLEYWDNPTKTAEKFAGEWMLTGDEAAMDEDGYVHFQSRTDDVITSSGYRIGPTEIENCLTGHPAVAMAAVIGVPDPVRTETIKAFVTLAPGNAAGSGRAESEELKAELVAHVRARLSPHLAPREIEVIDKIPTTATGKILRRALREP